jgi:glucokinase
MRIVTVDIGGTHARFALAEVKAGPQPALFGAAAAFAKDHTT